MKIAVFGGSFNPFHIGHGMVADSVIRELGYDKVIFVPTCVPPHKEMVALGATAEDRLGMIKAFCGAEGDGLGPDAPFLFDSCEIDRGGVSYTCDTLEYLTKKCKPVLDGKLGFIMGEEIAAEFHKWKNPDKIAQLADLIIIPRNPDYSRGDKGVAEHGNKPAGAYTGDFSVAFNGEDFGYPYKMLSQPVVSVSSTDIRNRIAGGKSFKYLVPSAVFEYIEEKRLYR